MAESIDVLVGHHDKEAFRGIFVGLKLVVCAVDSSAACEQQEQLAGRMRVIGRLRYISLNVVEFCDLLFAN